MSVSLLGDDDMVRNETVPDAKSYKLLGALYGFVINKIIPNLFESMSLSNQDYLGCNLSLWTLLAH